jgi:hypothetical protein
MRFVRITVGTAMVLCLALAPIDAASKGKAPAPAKVSSSKAPTKTTAKVTKAPKGTTSVKASSMPKTKTPKTTTTQTKLAKGETKSGKKSGTTSTTTTSQTKLAKAETKSAKKFGATSPTTSLTTTSSTTTPTTTTTIDFTKGKVGERLTKNTKLAEKLGNRLTAMGYTGDVYEAAYGFKNLGQFVATVNNAQNHNLSFEQLKTLMTGVSVDADGVVLYANRNPDGTVTMVPREEVTDPAPTKSLGQAKKTINTTVVETDTTTSTTVTK